MKNALIIGYGSIGKLHFQILKKLKLFNNIYIYTSQNIQIKNKLNNLKNLNELDITYVVIASPTSMHLKHLTIVNNQLNKIKILVEKPIFNNLNSNKLILKNKVFVGYDLRYHPVITKIKKLINNKVLWSTNIFCGSFLPEWRPGRDYTQTSSAKKQLGGGVVNDLSHEFDYLLWFFGDSKILFSYSKKISDLNINTEDSLFLVNKFKNNMISNIFLNYFTRLHQRKLNIDGKNISITADLMNNDITYFIKNKMYYDKFTNIKRETTHTLMHKNIILDSKIICCTYEDAIKIQKIIQTIKSK